MPVAPEGGEYIVGAYLAVVEKCRIVVYNARLPGGGQRGLHEIDVLGFNFNTSTVFVCEVTTHLRGTLYGKGNADTIKRLDRKHQWAQQYAQSELTTFKDKRYQFWSPYVPVGILTDYLASMAGLDTIINDEYGRRVQQLMERASVMTEDTGNPAFRTMQILQHLRESKNRRMRWHNITVKGE